MKKLLLIALALMSVNVCAYKIEIKNESDLNLDVAPRFEGWANDKRPTKWNVRPQSTFTHQSGIYCLRSIDLEAKNAEGKVVAARHLDAKGNGGIESTGANIRCGDYKIKVGFPQSGAAELIVENVK